MICSKKLKNSLLVFVLLKLLMTQTHSKNSKKPIRELQGIKMKYDCEQCSFHWEGTSYTFDQVREHEKRHTKIAITNRCKVCNTRNVDQSNTNGIWECEKCGNFLDSNGQVIST